MKQIMKAINLLFLLVQEIPHQNLFRSFLRRSSQSTLILWCLIIRFYRLSSTWHWVSVDLGCLIFQALNLKTRSQ